MARFYVSAAHKSSGKTTVTLGLCRALRERGSKVQAFKKGPDYIDPIWHAQASGRPSYNLDFRLMSRAEIQDLYGRRSLDADVTIVEGNKGLYDGMDTEGSDCNAAMARALGLPVVLVIDTSGVTRGIAPLLLGYQAFDPDVRIAGVILNKVGGPRHEGKLRQVIERYTDIPILGAIHRDARLDIEERHLGLVPGNESLSAEQRIRAIAEVVAAQVDLDALLAIDGDRPKPLDIPAAMPGTPVRLAIARDRAFGFYYSEDLDTLRTEGVDLLTVDTLQDAALPEVDGLILGGGFPESFIPELAANKALTQDIRNAIEAGLPVYAECGGLMYLSRSIRWGDEEGEMVGVVPGDAVMSEHPVGRGYAGIRETAACPLSVAPGEVIAAHEFHHSRLENLPTDLIYAYEVARGHGIDGRNDGFVYKNLLAAYCHRRGTGERGWIPPFLAKARAFARQRNAAAIAA